MLKVESSFDHINRIKELPSEELDEFRNELTVTSYHHSSLVRGTSYVSV